MCPCVQNHPQRGCVLQPRVARAGRATLGRPLRNSQPQRGCGPYCGAHPQPHWGWVPGNPFPKVACATLGWRPESRWDSGWQAAKCAYHPPHTMSWPKATPPPPSCRRRGNESLTFPRRRSEPPHVGSYKAGGDAEPPTGSPTTTPSARSPPANTTGPLAPPSPLRLPLVGDDVRRL